MTNTAAHENIGTDANVSDLDNLLAELEDAQLKNAKGEEIEAAEEIENSTEPVVVNEAEIEADALAALEAAEAEKAKQAAYEQQSAAAKRKEQREKRAVERNKQETSGNESTETPAEVKKRKAAERKAAAEQKRKEKAAERKAKMEARKAVAAEQKTKRVSIAGMKPSAALTTLLGVGWEANLSLASTDMQLSTSELAELNRERLERIDKLAKKQGEKTINLLKAAIRGGRVRKFTQMAVEFLRDKGSMTGVELRDHYTANGYTTGTANSNANQMMNMLPTLEIALSGEGKGITLNPDSTLVELLVNATAE